MIRSIQFEGHTDQTIRDIVLKLIRPENNDVDKSIVSVGSAEAGKWEPFTI